LNIHYVHKKSDVAEGIPLLFVHGCEIIHPKAFHFIEVMTPRAWELPRGTQASASVDEGDRRFPRISCRGHESSRIRVLAGSEHKGIWSRAVCRGNGGEDSYLMC
jgi:hypothetical protein